MQIIFIKYDYYYRYGLYSEKYLECIVKNFCLGCKKFFWFNNVNGMYRFCLFLFQGIQFFLVDVFLFGKYVVLGI